MATMMAQSRTAGKKKLDEVLGLLDRGEGGDMAHL